VPRDGSRPNRLSCLRPCWRRYRRIGALCRRWGCEPRPVDVELDKATRVGKVASENYVSDRTFFKMLGAEEVLAIDHSDYENAEIIINLNEPIDKKYEGIADFIFGGSVCDNVFDPAGYVRNVNRLLKVGGRFLDQNIATDHYHPYVVLPPAWYFDYFVLNRFADVKVYVFEVLNYWNAYFLDVSQQTVQIESFPQTSVDVVLGTFTVAEKAADSTWRRSPAQDQYRSAIEWQEIRNCLERIKKHPRPVVELLLNRDDTRLKTLPPENLDGYRYIGSFF
jgi:hypothetical protein